VSRAFPFEYVGSFHIHSTHSDGGGSAKQIAEAARTVGLDFIALNDHSYLTQLHLEDEGYHKGIPVLVGSEIGRRFHHYLAYNIKDQVNDESYSPQEVIDAVNRQGGFGFL
jgi:predicted metal-dependent phosphoesterase TrpH